MDTMDADHGLAKDLSVEDRRARAKLEADARIVDGRYEVPMLWKTDTPWLPDNKPMAERRLASLERKLRKDDGLHVEYSKCIRQLVEKGYAEKIEEDDQPQAGRTWYLPHHAVKHPKKGKVQVVFDSAANYKGVSLNTQLVQGPDLTNNLLGVLLRFRERKTAIVADIEAMFHQVRVAPEDADALRFLWWEDGNVDTPPATYKMLRHIFGATDSPCCANFALQKTADDNRTAFPLETAETVKRDFYVDDLLKSVDNTTSAIQLARDLRELLSRSGQATTERYWLQSIGRSERGQQSTLISTIFRPSARLVFFGTWKEIPSSSSILILESRRPSAVSCPRSARCLIRLASCLPSSWLRRS